jgi:ELWxxDGT repeat protein
MANNHLHGQELWTSDGTQLFFDINPGEGGSFVRYETFTEYNNELYFQASDTLWVTDGTKENTRQFLDVRTSALAQA